MARNVHPFEQDTPALLARCAQALAHLQIPQQAAAAQSEPAAAAKQASPSPSRSDAALPAADAQTVWGALQREPGGGIALISAAAPAAPQREQLRAVRTLPEPAGMTAEALSRAFERDARRYG